MTSGVNLLNAITDEYRAFNDTISKRIIICAGTGCVAGGALDVYDALKSELQNQIGFLADEKEAEMKWSREEQKQPC